MRHILHCDMNAFYASVEVQRHPELRGKPVAVCGSQEERHGIVLTANYVAKPKGVKTGSHLAGQAGLPGPGDPAAGYGGVYPDQPLCPGDL